MQQKRKTTELELWRTAITEEITSIDQGRKISFTGWLKGLYFRFTGSRKHPRKTVDFSNPTRVWLKSGDFHKEVTPADISRGGMGIRLPIPYVAHFKRGQIIQLSISFEEETWHQVEGEIRFLIKESPTHASMGIQFATPPKELIKAIHRQFDR